MSVQTRGHDKDQSQKEAKPAPPNAPRGFSAQLRGAGLWDLVQMECLARSRRTVQVVGEGGVGYLHFDRGQIVHASTALQTGQAAAIEILGWTNGSFQSCDRPWPEQRSIGVSHEALLLQAAKLRDESEGSNLVAFPARSGIVADDMFEELELSGLAEEAEEGDGAMRGSNMDEAVPTTAKTTTPSGGTDAGVEFSVMMRLGPSGVILSNRGGSEDLADTVAYVERLLQLSGELLGLGPFAALECAFAAEGRCFIFTDGSSETVALRARPDANLQALRERLGL